MEANPQPAEAVTLKLVLQTSAPPVLDNIWFYDHLIRLFHLNRLGSDFQTL